MEQMAIQDKPGLLSKLALIFSRTEEGDDFEETSTPSRADTNSAFRPSYRYTVTVRRQITSFEDAWAAANGLKSGEQQILNLSATDAATRQKIVDFMCGVNFAQEGTWEEIGENIYMVVPSNAHVEVVPPTPRTSAHRN